MARPVKIASVACGGLVGLLVVVALAVPAEKIEIHGRVTDSEGRPLAGATIELRPIPSAWETAEAGVLGWAGPPAVAEARSGRDGGFLIAAPEAGPWRVVVSDPEHLALGVELEPNSGSRAG